MKLASLLICCFSASAADSAPLTAGQIVERHIAALGGIEKIHRLHSVVIRGMYHEPGPFPPGTPDEPRNYMALMRPYYQVIGDPDKPHPQLREGFDGSSWEYYGDPGIVVRTTGAAAAAARHTAEFLRIPSSITKGRARASRFRAPRRSPAARLTRSPPRSTMDFRSSSSSTRNRI